MSLSDGQSKSAAAGADGSSRPGQAAPQPPSPLVMDEIVEETPAGYGKYLGRVKWFQDKKGHGFIVVMSPREEAGREVFVHFTGIRPMRSLFKTLRKNEYVHFNVCDGKQGVQAVNVTGVMGGPLICDGYPQQQLPQQQQ